MNKEETINNFKKAIQQLNNKEITLEEYAEITLPLWQKMKQKNS